MGRRWISYNRVSEDRHDGRSVDEQAAENRRTATRFGDEIVIELVDNSVGASRYSRGDRPQWQQAIAMLERREADGIMTWEASRSTRDLDVYVQLRKVCRLARALWCYNGRVYDLNDGDDSFQTALDILLAEKEVEQTRKRVLRSTQANAERGLPHGKLLYGYRRVYAANGAFIAQVPDETQAPIVREVYRRLLAGDPIARIVSDLRARGLKTGRGAEWTYSQVNKMVHNPAYAGLRVHRGQVVGKAVWDGLVSEADYYQVVALYAARRAGKRHDGAIKYLLSGAARCGVCGGKIVVQKPRGYLTYLCKDNFCVARKLGAVDALITDLVIARLSRPDILSVLAVDNDPALDALDKLAALRARLDGFYAAAAAGELSPQALASIEKSLLPQLEAAEAKIRRINVPGIIHEVAADPAAIWPKLNIIQKREVIVLLMTIYIGKTRRGERTFNPESIRVVWNHGD